MENAATGMSTEAGAGRAPIRLLVVEDHADTATMLAKLLGSAGYSVKTAGSAAGALELASREPFDLVVSDIGLPDATGYHLMQQIKERYGMNGIAMSGYGMDEDIRKSREAGFSEHLVKPISFAQLTQAIHRLIRGGQ
ncbi:MAG: response regulator [Tepidisphaeraceae bacterium]